MQLDNLRTHPPVAAGLAGGDVRLHGWVYAIQTGEVTAYDAERGLFVPLTDRHPAALPRRSRLATADAG